MNITNGRRELKILQCPMLFLFCTYLPKSPCFATSLLSYLNTCIIRLLSRTLRYRTCYIATVLGITQLPCNILTLSPLSLLPSSFFFASLCSITLSVLVMPSIAVTCSAVFPSPPLAIPPPLPITSPPSPISLPSTPLRRSKPLSPPDLLDVLLQSSSPTPHFITNASQTQLLALLPVILYSIHSSSSLLLPPLKARLLSSRRLKLRFLLLCRHPAFKHISPRLHFSSAAYAETIYTPLPRSHTPSQKSTLASSLLRLPVDMVRFIHNLQCT